jgi:hypothetical protein
MEDSPRDLLPEKGYPSRKWTMNLRGYFFWDAFRGTTVRSLSDGIIDQEVIPWVIDRCSISVRMISIKFSTSEIFLSPFIGCSVPVSDAMVMQCEIKVDGDEQGYTTRSIRRRSFQSAGMGMSVSFLDCSGGWNELTAFDYWCCRYGHLP